MSANNDPLSYENCPDLGEKLKNLRRELTFDQASELSGFVKEEDRIYYTDLNISKRGISSSSLDRLEKHIDDGEYDLRNLNSTGFIDLLRYAYNCDDNTIIHMIRLVECNYRRQLLRRAAQKQKELEAELEANKSLNE
jgi:hypothetical protein